MTATVDPIVQLAAFLVGEEEYVVDIMRVRAIVRDEHVVPYRKGPNALAGVLNLRGHIIYVIDLRQRFNMAPCTSGKRKILIVQIEGHVFGLRVDAVTEVVRVLQSSILPAPSGLEVHQAPFFLGVCHHRDRPLILLNVRAVVTHDGLLALPQMPSFAGGLIDEKCGPMLEAAAPQDGAPP